ncbi:MAG: hypothetical protein HZLCBSQH_002031 [Candidatus Fervidibacterota bacterium]
MKEGQAVLLIVNPKAGGGKGRSWGDRLTQALRRRFPHVHTVFTERTGSAAQAVANYDADLILVAGGDGVFHDAINGLWRTGKKIPIALIPIGTGNVFASNFAIPFHPLKALQVLLEGQVRWLDLGHAYGQVFHCSLGIGFDAYVVARLEAERPTLLKRLLGRLAYVVSALRHSLRYEWSHISVTAQLPDGSQGRWEREAWLVLVTNLPDYGGVPIAPDAQPDDGALDLVILPSQSKLDYFRFAVMGWLGWHRRHPEVVVQRIRCAHILSDPPVPTQMDGELTPETPVTVEVIPCALPVLLPRPQPRRLPKALRKWRKPARGDGHRA